MKKLFVFLFLSPLLISETYVCNVDYVKKYENADFERIIEIKRNKNVFSTKIINITTLNNNTSKTTSEFPLKLIFEDERQIDLVGPTLEFIVRIYKDGPYLYMTHIHEVGHTMLNQQNNCTKIWFIKN